MSKKDDSIAIMDSILRYLDKKKVSDNVKKKIVDDISKKHNDNLNFCSDNNVYSNPLEYVDNRRKKQ